MVASGTDRSTTRRGARASRHLELALVLAAVLAWPGLAAAKVHRRGHPSTKATPSSVSRTEAASRGSKRHARASRVPAPLEQTGRDFTVVLPAQTTPGESRLEGAAGVPRRPGYQGTTNVGSEDAPIWKVTIDGQ